jgi:hypothetical protein
MESVQPLALSSSSGECNFPSARMVVAVTLLICPVTLSVCCVHHETVGVASSLLLSHW